MRRRWLLLIATPSLLLGLAACGDTNDDETADDAASLSEPGESAAACDEPVVVQIPEFSFDPDPVNVEAGCELVWENTHDQAHTSTGNADQTWRTGNIQPGQTSEPVAFPGEGEFTYICSLHPFMGGTVSVSST